MGAPADIGFSSTSRHMCPFKLYRPGWASRTLGRRRPRRIAGWPKPRAKDSHALLALQAPAWFATGMTELDHGVDPHTAGHASRLNWLRAGVLGANDGIVSVAPSTPARSQFSLEAWPAVC